MADLKHGGKDGGNVVMGSPEGGPLAGSAKWEFPKNYDPAKHTAFLPFLADWTADGEPLVFLAPADRASAEAGPYQRGVVRVQQLDDKGEESGPTLSGVAVGFLTAPKPGDVVRVSYRLDRDE